MNIHPGFRLAVVPLCLAVASLVAQPTGAPPPSTPPPLREYGWVEAGYAYLPDFDATLTVVTTNTVTNQDARMEMGPGFAAHGGLGETFSRYVSAELLGGFYYHNVDQITMVGGVPRGLDADLMQAPVMVNLVLQIPLRSRFTPVLGGGGGAVFSWLDVDDQISTGNGSVLHVEGSSTEVTFAYQAFAGLRYRHGEGASVSLTYRFTGSGSPTWDLEDGQTGDSVVDVKAHNLFVHSINLGFHIGF